MKHWIEENDCKGEEDFEKYNPPPVLGRAAAGAGGQAQGSPLIITPKRRLISMGLSLMNLLRDFQLPNREDTNPEEVKMLLLP